MRPKTQGTLIAIALAAVGCASTSSTSTDTTTARDVAEMKERILELQETAAMTQVELERLQTTVNDLQRKLEGGSQASTPTATESPAPSQSAAEEPVGVSNTSVVVVESSDLEGEPDPEVAAGPASGEAPTPPPEEILPSPIPAGPLQPVEPAAQALYDRGYTLYHQGKYLDAEASFQRFLQAYSNTELSDNAQFWIGEARFARNDLQGAMAAFREVIQKYPQGNKVPDSLIKEGDCLAMLGDKDGARDRFEEVRRRFPDSGASVVAEDRLSKLDG